MSARGRPPRVTYEQVELAALEIVSAGGRPTVGAIQQKLDVRSSTLVSRHLSQWERARRATRARTPFTVGAEDVAVLGPADFTRLLNHLIRLEARILGVPTAPDLTVRTNDPDGGIDGRLVWQGDPEPTPRLPARHLVWQFKTGQRLSESALSNELLMTGGPNLKPRVREALAAGGTYVLFSAADMTPDQKLRRVAAMSAAALPHSKGVEPHIAIVAGEEIAAWAAQDLAARSLLIRAAGRDHPALLTAYDEWTRQEAYQNPYVWTDGTDEIAKQIRAVAQTPGALFRLTGAPGLGKSRLALEALRTLAEADGSVVYFDARYPNSGLQLLSAIPEWRRRGVGGVLVVDDCDLTLHQQIAGAIAGSSMSVITIFYRYESPTNPQVGNALRPTTPNVIEKIVGGFGGQIGAANFRRIVEYAEGWPLMAVLVHNALRNEHVMIADLTDDQLTERLIGERENSDAYATLALLALFDHVGCIADVAGEWAQLRETFLPSVPADKAVRFIEQFIRKRLISQIGRYWRVTPPPLALRLTRRWLECTSSGKRTELFTVLSPALTEALANRFGDVTTETSLALAEELLSPSGPFGTLKGLLGKTNTSIVQELSSVNPAAGAAALTRILGSLSEKQLFGIDEEDGRQNLVWTLEALAFHRAHFQSAARLLFALARNENAKNGNNASGTLEKLFAVEGSQTEAPPELRVVILKEMLRIDTRASRDLVARCLKRILSIHPATVMLGVESQGGRPALVEWRPTIWKPIFDYLAEAVTIGLELSTRKDGFDLARDVIADGLPLLARYRRWDDVERAVARLKGPAWPKAVDRLNWSIRHDLPAEDAGDVARASGILRSLMPSDFKEQVKLYVSDAPLQLEQVENSAVDRSIENVDRFAQSVIDQGRVRDAFELVSTGMSHRLPHAFGQAIARRTADRQQVVDDVFVAFANADEPRNDLALMSVLGTLSELDPSVRQPLLQRIFDDQRLIAALPAAVIWPRVDGESIDLLIRAFREGRIPEPPRANLFMGSAYAAVPTEKVRELADVFLARGWYHTVIALLTFGIQDRSGLDDVFQRVIIASKFIEKPMEDIHEWTLFEIAKRLARESAQFAVAITDALIGLAMSKKADFGARRRVSELWPEVLRHDAVWQDFVERYGSLGRRERWGLLIATQQSMTARGGERLAIEGRPRADLIAFAEAYPDDVPMLLAQYGTTTRADKDGRLRFTPLIVDLLEYFGDRDDVLRALDASLQSFLTVGPRAGYYAERIRMLDELPTSRHLKVQLWKETLQSQLDRERRQAQLDDDEMEQGIF